jgi:hypothetical protein
MDRRTDRHIQETNRRIDGQTDTQVKGHTHTRFIYPDVDVETKTHAYTLAVADTGRHIYIPIDRYR